MTDRANLFLNTLLRHCDVYRERACLTLTAIHPDGKHRTPSRHLPLNQTHLLDDALERLLAVNTLGWGAFVGVALRRTGLTRYQRGTERDLVALPAVFVDLDDPSSDALRRLRDLRPTPSCITFTGGGYHAYWWLDQPLTDMTLARKLLRGLAEATGGDSLSPAQSLRLVGSRNTKPHRKEALCRVIHLQDTVSSAADFEYLLPQRKTTYPRARQTTRPTDSRINPDVLRAVSDTFLRMGYKPSGDWLSGACIYPENHLHDDAHPSFGFNTRSGYGHCFRCGSILLKDICTEIGIHPADYGGLFTSSG